MAGSNPLERIRGGQRSEHTAAAHNSRQFLMLDVRCKNGDQYGLSYAYLVGLHMHGNSREEKHLEMQFTGHKVVLHGRNLHILYDRMLSHSLSSVQESETPFDTEEESNAFVSSIKVELY